MRCGTFLAENWSVRTTYGVKTDRGAAKMRGFAIVVAGILLGVAGQVLASGQQETPVPPPPTATPAHPFFITKTWVIGGVGDWDYLTMDAATREFFIALGPRVQAVDVDSGTVAGSV